MTDTRRDVENEDGNVGARTPEDSDVDKAWEQQNLLSLDGGGIRGYWTLLALETLVDNIALIEMDDPQQEFVAVDSSFAPLDYPDNVCHLAPNGNDRGRRFLICHYFDLIIGSSTGALIALLLGRFRMTVQDSLDEYRSLGDAVFGHPRMLTQRNAGVIKRSKYKAARLEKVVKDVTERRSEFQEHGTPQLPLKEGVCQVCVTSLKTKARTAAHPYFMRTYDGSKRTRYQPEAITHIKTGLTSGTNDSVPSTARRGPGMRHTPGDKLNFGEVQQLHIWQVARAATAAISYFEPLKIQIAGEGESIFEDGGFGQLNNPSMRGKAEIKNLHGPGRLDIAVSIGTARREEAGGKRHSWGIIRSLAATVTDVDGAHQVMLDCCKPEEENFDYFRFNAEAEHALEIPLDEWEPKGIKAKITNQQAGTKTIQNIRNAYASWAIDPQVQQDFRDCARALVRKRRVRASKVSRWEAFAIATFYQCRIAPCSHSHGAVRRDTFKRHLEENHPDVLPDQIDRVISDHKKNWIYRPARES